MLPIIMQNETPSNPGYLVAIAKPLLIVNMNVNQNNTLTISGSQFQSQWFIDFNFNTHPEIANDGHYTTALSYTFVSPNTNSLVISTSSLYNNHAGIVLVGGVQGIIYTITVGIVLDNSEVLSYSQKLTVGA